MLFLCWIWPKGWAGISTYRRKMPDLPCPSIRGQKEIQFELENERPSAISLQNILWEGRSLKTQSLLEQSGGTYRWIDDVLIPDLSVEETVPIGRWGRMHRQYLKEHHPAAYSTISIEVSLLYTKSKILMIKGKLLLPSVFLLGFCTPSPPGAFEKRTVLPSGDGKGKGASRRVPDQDCGAKTVRESRFRKKELLSGGKNIANCMLGRCRQGMFLPAASRR